MDQNQSTVPSLFGNPQVTQEGIMNRRTQRSPVQYVETFVNNLGVPVTMMLRNGLKFVLPPEQDVNHNTLTVRVNISIGPAAYNSVVDFFAQLPEDAPPELRTMQESFGFSVRTGMYRKGEIVLDYSLTLAQLEEMGGSVYYSELDKVVSLAPISADIHHPYTKEGRERQILVEAKQGLSEKSFGYSIIMVDNTGLMKPRYVNISGQVYKVVPTQDYRQQDGIYIVSNHSMSSRGSTGAFEKRYYSFENAEESLGLWLEYEDALHAGDLPAARKKELLDKEHELAKLRLDRQELEQRYAKEAATQTQVIRELTLAQEKEQAAIARERAEFEYQEKLRRKNLEDHFEERSYVRKDQSEGLKFLPTVLIGLSALFGFLKLT